MKFQFQYGLIKAKEHIQTKRRIFAHFNSNMV